MRKFIIIALLNFSTVNLFAQGNAFGGDDAGNAGTNNTGFGDWAAHAVTGAGNSFFGNHSGRFLTSGSNNTFLGFNTGYNTIIGTGNVFIGANVGYNELGSNKLFIDNSNTTLPLIFGDFSTNQVGINSLPNAGALPFNTSVTLTVGGAVNASAFYVNGQPLNGSPGQWTTINSDIYFNTGNVGLGLTNPNYKLDVSGTINATALLVSGNVGLGTSNPNHRLDVNGAINASAIYINGQPFAGGGSQWTTVGSNINFNGAGVVSIGTTRTPVGYKFAVGGKMIAEEIIVDIQANWPDYVFERDYKLPSLEELSQYISKHKHLPGVPSAKEIQKNGVNVGEMNVILLEKIEELTLHLIEMKEQLNAQQKVIQELSKKE